MTLTEREQLTRLQRIAAERDSPLSPWERNFLRDLDRLRNLPLTFNRAEVFDDLVAKHLEGDE